MLPVEAPGGSLVLVRDSNGNIRAVHNVCSHRGARLVVDSLKGAPALTCPNYAWSFELDGKLIGRTHFHRPDQHERGNGRNRGEVCFFEMRSHIWHD